MTTTVEFFSAEANQSFPLNRLSKTNFPSTSSSLLFLSHATHPKHYVVEEFYGSIHIEGKMAFQGRVNLIFQIFFNVLSCHDGETWRGKMENVRHFRKKIPLNKLLLLFNGFGILRLFSGGWENWVIKSHRDGSSQWLMSSFLLFLCSKPERLVRSCLMVAGKEHLAHTNTLYTRSGWTSCRCAAPLHADAQNSASSGEISNLNYLKAF